MRRLALAVGSAIAVAVLTTAVPASAGDDMTFPSKEASSLTALAAHQPYWALLAECAGVFGAGYNFEAGRGDARAADDDKAMGESMLNDSIERLMADHDISHDDALAFAGDQVNVGREQGADLLSHGSVGAASQWNYKRSACIEIQDTYHRERRRHRS
jgi:hypothetical protein